MVQTERENGPEKGRMGGFEMKNYVNSLLKDTFFQISTSS